MDISVSSTWIFHSAKGQPTACPARTREPTYASEGNRMFFFYRDAILDKHAFMCILVYMYVYIYIHINTHIYIYTYIYTYIHMYHIREFEKICLRYLFS